MVAVFGYDAQVWRTLKFAWIPGKLPELYRSGHRKSLVHPVRFFVFVFILLALLLQLLNDEGQNDAEIIKSVSETNASVDLPNNIPIADTSTVENSDKNSVDSVALIVIKPSDKSLTMEVVPKSWLYDKDAEEISDHLGLDHFLQKMVLQKHIKLLKSDNSFQAFLIQTFMWMLLIMQPFIALWLFIPVCQRTYYSDHLIFTMYTHTSIFLFLIIWLGLLEIDLPEESTVLDISIIAYWIGMFVFILTALKRYYKLSVPKSIVFWVYSGIMYLISFVSIFVLNLVVSFLLF